MKDSAGLVSLENLLDLLSIRFYKINKSSLIFIYINVTEP